jgi:hypothetical protein
MRLLQTAATAFFTTVSSSSPQQLAALPRRRAIVASSFLPLALLLVVTPARGISTTDGVAASCNATPTLATMDDYDVEYPGTSVRRLQAVQARVATLAANGSLINHPWPEVRRQLLWAGGLRDLPNASPGMGYTGHSFNDYNHVDLTTMNDEVSDNLNDGSVRGIAIGNKLGPGVRIASLPELGPGGSWSTCALGCNALPKPQDVAHVQFRSRIAFKLVWVPNATYDMFVLVNDDGKLLAKGQPTGTLPSRREREMNYNIMKGSKYAVEADKLVNDA